MMDGKETNFVRLSANHFTPELSKKGTTMEKLLKPIELDADEIAAVSGGVSLNNKNVSGKTNYNNNNVNSLMSNYNNINGNSNKKINPRDINALIGRILGCL